MCIDAHYLHRWVSPVSPLASVWSQLLTPRSPRLLGLLSVTAWESRLSSLIRFTKLPLECNELALLWCSRLELEVQQSTTYTVTHLQHPATKSVSDLSLFNSIGRKSLAPAIRFYQCQQWDTQELQKLTHVCFQSSQTPVGREHCYPSCTNEEIWSWSWL